jgi:hypothetical protein
MTKKTLMLIRMLPTLLTFLIISNLTLNISYGKEIKNIVFAVGDNAPVNKSIADKLGVPLVGCASHRWNLEVIRWLEPHEHLLLLINNISGSESDNNVESFLLEEYDSYHDIEMENIAITPLDDETPSVGSDGWVVL